MKIEYIFIKSADEYYETEEMFINFLCANKRIVFESVEKKILFNEQKLSYNLECNEVEESKEISFHFVVEISGNDDKHVSILEEFDSLIKNINEKCGNIFSINTIWNDVSLHYARKLYPKFLNVENLLRKIIYLFMLKTVGSDWINKGTPEKFQSDINDVIKKNDENKKEINADWLTYADFITLGYFFTAPYPLKSNLHALFTELKPYEISDNVESEKKTESEEHILTEETIKKLSDEYEPRSNWERYFTDKLKVNSSNKFSKDWSSLYNIRNKVAHGKPISKEVFDKATNLINTYTTAFEECIGIIDTLKITMVEAKAVEAVAQQVIPKASVDILGVSNAYTPKLNRGDFITSIEELNRMLSKVKDNVNYDDILAKAGQMQYTFIPISKPGPFLPNISENLDIERIRTALDQPIMIDS